MKFYIFLLALPLFFSCQKDHPIPDSDYFPLQAGKKSIYQTQLRHTHDSSVYSDGPIPWIITEDTVIEGNHYNGWAIQAPAGNWIIYYIRKEGSVYYRRTSYEEIEYSMLDESKPVGYKWEGRNTKFEIAGKYKSRTYEGKTFEDVIEVKEYREGDPANYYALTAYSNHTGIVYEFRPYALGLYYAHSSAVLLE